jgi:hypothetical protein
MLMRIYNLFTEASTSAAVTISLKTKGLDFQYTSNQPSLPDSVLRECMHKPLTFMCGIFTKDDVLAVRDIYDSLEDDDAKKKWVTKNLILALPGATKKSAYYLPRRNRMVRVCVLFFRMVLQLPKGDLYLS